MGLSQGFQLCTEVPNYHTPYPQLLIQLQNHCSPALGVVGFRLVVKFLRHVRGKVRMKENG